MMTMVTTITAVTHSPIGAADSGELKVFHADDPDREKAGVGLAYAPMVHRRLEAGLGYGRGWG